MIVLVKIRDVNGRIWNAAMDAPDHALATSDGQVIEIHELFRPGVAQSIVDFRAVLD